MITINPEKIVYERVSNTEINPERLVRNVNRSGEFIFRGGLALQAEMGAQNVERFTRFLTTPQGVKFLAQQKLLQLANPTRAKVRTGGGNEGNPNTDFTSEPYQQTQRYDATAPFKAKALSQEFIFQKPVRHRTSATPELDQVRAEAVGLAKDKAKEFAETFQTNLFGDIKKSILGEQEKKTKEAFPPKSSQGAFRNKDEHPDAYVTGSRDTTNAVTYFSNKEGKETSLQVRYGGELNNIKSFPSRMQESGSSMPNDFIKFHIRDAVNGRYIIFPALLEGNISDNSSTTPTESSYIGRAEKVYVYGSYTRTISFSVNIVASREEEIGIIWEKVNAAKGLVTPEYKKFTGMDGAERPISPICYLTLGDLYNDTPGFFTSVNLAIPEGSTWTLTDGTQVPHICTLAFEFTFIGKEVPTMTSKHYDNIQKEFPKVKGIAPSPGGA